MSSQGNGQTAFYTLSVSRKVAAEIRLSHREALQRGADLQFILAFRQIAPRLKKDPMVFGEPLFHLPALKLQVRKAAITPIVVDFAVHEEKKLVFIRGIKLMS